MSLMDSELHKSTSECSLIVFLKRLLITSDGQRDASPSTPGKMLADGGKQIRIKYQRMKDMSLLKIGGGTEYAL